MTDLEKFHMFLETVNTGRLPPGAPEHYQVVLDARTNNKVFTRLPEAAQQAVLEAAPHAAEAKEQHSVSFCSTRTTIYIGAGDKWKNKSNVHLTCTGCAVLTDSFERKINSLRPSIPLPNELYEIMTLAQWMTRRLSLWELFPFLEKTFTKAKHSFYSPAVLPFPYMPSVRVTAEGLELQLEGEQGTLLAAPDKVYWTSASGKTIYKTLNYEVT